MNAEIYRLKPICTCEEHSEYLFADVGGWHCETCGLRVPRDATNRPKQEGGA